MAEVMTEKEMMLSNQKCRNGFVFKPNLRRINSSPSISKCTLGFYQIYIVIVNALCLNSKYNVTQMQIANLTTLLQQSF